MDYGEWFNPCLQYRLGVIRVLRRRLHIKDLRAMIYRYLPFADQCLCTVESLYPYHRLYPFPSKKKWAELSSMDRVFIVRDAFIYLGIDFYLPPESHHSILAVTKR